MHNTATLLEAELSAELSATLRQLARELATPGMSWEQTHETSAHLRALNDLRREVRAGDIGEPLRRIETVPSEEPLTVPSEWPVPAEEPSEQPSVPVPA